VLVACHHHELGPDQPLEACLEAPVEQIFQDGSVRLGHFLWHCVHVTVDEWLPAKLIRFNVNHTTARYSGRGGLLQVRCFEHHTHRTTHLNDFTRHQTQLFIVVKYRVHVLNPHGVNGTVKNKPLAKVFHIAQIGLFAIVDGQDTIGPLVRNGIETTVQLAHRD